MTSFSSEETRRPIVSVPTGPAQALQARRHARILVVDGVTVVGRPEPAWRHVNAAVLTAVHPGLLTIAVGVLDGCFVIEFSDGAAELGDGAELAAALPALSLYAADVRMWIDWPNDPRERARLRRGVRALAESTGATIWAPPEGGRARVEPSCRDLAALDSTGNPAMWHAHQPDPPSVTRYVSDPDGRLIPTSGLALTGRPGVALISADEDRLRGMAHRYADRDGHDFLIDLPVTDDGRLAAWCTDGSLFVLGPRHLVRLLEMRGWKDQTIRVLAELTAAQKTGLTGYARELSAALRRDLLIAAGAQPATGTQRSRALALTPAVRSPAAGGHLATMVASLVAELPKLQREVRGLATARPDLAAELLDAWYHRHHELTRARYTGAVRAIRANQEASPAEIADAAEHAASLARADAILRERLAVPAHGAVTETSRYVDSTWAARLRPAIAMALASLNVDDPAEARQLRRLCELVAQLAIDTTPDEIHDDDRLLLERLVIGAPEPPPADPTVTARGGVAPSPTEADGVPPGQVLSGIDAPKADPYDEQYGPDPTRTGEEWVPAAVFLARPRIAPANRRTKPHGLAWLPELPQVNDESFDVYVRSAWATDRAAAEGIPSARLFLIGHLSADGGGAAHTVRVRVEPHGAVDVPATGIEPPVALGPEVIGVDAYVIPADWLDHCKIILASGGTAPARLCCSGASHGINGLPEDIPRWPTRWRSPGIAYAILQEAGDKAETRDNAKARDNVRVRDNTEAGEEAVEPAIEPVRLYRRRPPAQAGRLVQLRIDAGLAVDIAATARRLAPPPTVRTILPELRGAGVDLLLPPESFAKVRIRAAFTAKGSSWRAVDPPRQRTIPLRLTHETATASRGRPDDR
jgi:hypothetical protein